jgi:hypothetical protein
MEEDLSSLPLLHGDKQALLHGEKQRTAFSRRRTAVVLGACGVVGTTLLIASHRGGETLRGNSQLLATASSCATQTGCATHGAQCSVHDTSKLSCLEVEAGFRFVNDIVEACVAQDGCSDTPAAGVGTTCSTKKEGFVACSEANDGYYVSDGVVGACPVVPNSLPGSTKCSPPNTETRPVYKFTVNAMMDLSGVSLTRAQTTSFSDALTRAIVKVCKNIAWPAIVRPQDVTIVSIQSTTTSASTNDRRLTASSTTSSSLEDAVQVKFDVTQLLVAAAGAEGVDVRIPAAQISEAVQALINLLQTADLADLITQESGVTVTIPATITVTPGLWCDPSPGRMITPRGDEVLVIPPKPVDLTCNLGFHVSASGYGCDACQTQIGCETSQSECSQQQVGHLKCQIAKPKYFIFDGEAKACDTIPNAYNGDYWCVKAGESRAGIEGQDTAVCEPGYFHTAGAVGVSDTCTACTMQPGCEQIDVDAVCSTTPGSTLQGTILQPHSELLSCAKALSGHYLTGDIVGLCPSADTTHHVGDIQCACAATSSAAPGSACTLFLKFHTCQSGYAYHLRPRQDIISHAKAGPNF